jgi:DNA-binding response OmpR family regulator
MAQLTEQILVVEDNQDVRELLALILSKEGYVLHKAHDGTSALAIAREFKPKLILLDVMLPGISGLEILQEIRQDKDRGVREALVLMITAKSQPQDIENALLYGATSYLIKPFRPAALVESVHRLLHPPSLTQE